MLEVLKGVPCMQLCILEAIEVVLKVSKVVLYVPEVVNGMRWALVVLLYVLFCMLLCILKAVKGEFCLLEVLE